MKDKRHVLLRPYLFIYILILAGTALTLTGCVTEEWGEREHHEGRQHHESGHHERFK